MPPGLRDAAIEEYLGIAHPRPDSAAPGDHLIGYHTSSLAVVVKALVDAPVVENDVLVDLGSGLGKVVMLARLLTGAVARGIEIQSDLVQRSRRAAEQARIEVSFSHADARSADLDDGTVFFLYDPFAGPVVNEVLERLRRVAARRSIVVCALGIDLDADWLKPRSGDSFWLTIYDSAIPGVPARPLRSSPIKEMAVDIANERLVPVGATPRSAGQ